MNKYLMSQQLKYLPIDQFLKLSVAGHREPDPVPKALFAAAFFFVISAILTVY